VVESALPNAQLGVPLAQLTAAAAASGIIGAVTFWGSLVAFAKLQGLVSDNPLQVGFLHYINGVLLLTAIGLGGMLVLNPTTLGYYWALLAVASVVGLLLVIPIGGGGYARGDCAAELLFGAGGDGDRLRAEQQRAHHHRSLVGASGIILTTIMCRAMNRSLRNVLFGVGSRRRVRRRRDVYGGRIKAASPDEVAMLLEGARTVVVVPGYGMAVAQAQHAVRDLMQILEQSGAQVLFAIHPVAGRMPGHMNVLLAEADVPYDRLKEMDEINPMFEQVDVAIVIGANDVVNPLARTDPNSPIAGMPILDVDKARSVVVIKRSLSPGFAGIPNPLFAADNTLMLFADAREGVQQIIGALKGK
jgi:H+-translocating NAD(P) transhydrogenase subunit beta